MLRLLPPGIKRVSAELTANQEAEVKPSVSERIGESSDHIWLSILRPRNPVCLGRALCDFLDIVAILIRIICIELRRSCLRIDSGKLHHIEGPVWIAHLANLRTADDLRLHSIKGKNPVPVM